MLDGIKTRAQKMLGVHPEQQEPGSGNVNTFANKLFSILSKAERYPREALTHPELLIELRPAIRNQKTYGTAN